MFTQGCYIASSLLGVKFGFSVHMADKLQQKDENLPGRPVGLRRAGRLMLGARSEGQAKVLRQAGVGGAVDGESHWQGHWTNAACKGRHASSR